MSLTLANGNGTSVCGGSVDNFSPPVPVTKPQTCPARQARQSGLRYLAQMSKWVQQDPHVLDSAQSLSQKAEDKNPTAPLPWDPHAEEQLVYQSFPTSDVRSEPPLVSASDVALVTPRPSFNVEPPQPSSLNFGRKRGMRFRIMRTLKGGVVTARLGQSPPPSKSAGGISADQSLCSSSPFESAAPELPSSAGTQPSNRLASLRGPVLNNCPPAPECVSPLTFLCPSRLQILLWTRNALQARGEAAAQAWLDEVTPPRE